MAGGWCSGVWEGVKFACRLYEERFGLRAYLLN